jgi:hypothetical protein
MRALIAIWRQKRRVDASTRREPKMQQFLLHAPLRGWKLLLTTVASAALLLWATFLATPAHAAHLSHKLSRVAAGLVLASALGICAAAAAIGTAAADIISTVGLTIVSAPSIVTGDFIANSGGALPSQLIFAEQQNVLLGNPLVTDTGTIPAGTSIDSYFFAVNSFTQATVNTSVTFASPILGIVYQDGAAPYSPNPQPFNPNFANSNFLGAIGTTYSLGGAKCGPFCGFEVVPSPDMDAAWFVGNTAFFHNYYSTPGDFARIITTDPPTAVPVPNIGAGLLVLVSGGLLGWWRRRRQSA